MLEDNINVNQEPLHGAVLYTAEQDFSVAIYFDYIEDETLSTEASITDNYTESNYSIQDHIAIKPKIYRLRGCVGEVVYRNQYNWNKLITTRLYQNSVIQRTMNILKPISAVSGIVSSYTQSAKNLINQIESSFNRYKQMYDRFKQNNIYSNQRQQTVVSILNRLLTQRIPVNLDDLKFQDYVFGTGTEKYYVQSVSSHQGNNDFISDIEVTIKEFRVATTQTTALDKNKFGGITQTVSNMKSDEVNGGNANGQEVPKDVVTKTLDKVQENILKDAGQTALNFRDNAFYGAIKTAFNTITNAVGITNNPISNVVSNFSIYKGAAK